jgi:hypothetical protein
MCQQIFRGLVATLLLLFARPITPSRADDQATSDPIREEDVGHCPCRFPCSPMWRGRSVMGRSNS